MKCIQYGKVAALVTQRTLGVIQSAKGFAQTIRRSPFAGGPANTTIVGVGGTAVEPV